MKIKHVVSVAVVAVTLTSLPVKQATAGSNPFIGEIMWVGFNFCPSGWADADGQLIRIVDNGALFRLYGTTYGGDGRTTFALPDLRGRVSVHTGTGPGLSPYVQGRKGGAEQVRLAASEMPLHNHRINASRGAISQNPAGSILGSPKQKVYDAPVSATTILDNSAVSDAGGSGAHENRSPYLTLRACVALTGIAPLR